MLVRYNFTSLRITLLKFFPASLIFNLSDEDLEFIIAQRKNRSLMTDQPDILELDCGGTTLINLSTIYAENYHVYCSIFVCVFGSVANILNIVVLTRKEMAGAPINRILSALAVADVLLMIEYIPFAYYYDDERGKQNFCYYGAVFTLFHINYSQVLHTISVCLTLSLAIWRFLAIGYPKRNHQLCSNARCTLTIWICYILPLFLCIPAYYIFDISTIVIKENDQNVTLYHTDLKEDVKKNKTLLKINFWLFAVLIKLLPCFILTIISLWLIKTLFDAKKRRQVLRGYDCFPLTVDGKEIKRKGNKTERRSDRTTKMLVAVLLLFLITEFPQGIFALLIGIKGHDLFLQCYQQYGEIMDIMALTNGSINFILYCCMNRMFRMTFNQLFRPKILNRLAGNASDVPTTAQRNQHNDTVNCGIEITKL
ncbi:G-protein coupled receptor dmsr-1 isoform X1 [Diabrotica undecimpunctata]|uniref:G-protein coupled receptor dmsr-1 isoform X1 n=2 Tax=Diabrotica undecimpunctata TaxID=50387 RepID=UPI003B63951F